MSLKRRRSLDNDGMFHLVPFYSVVIPSSLTQQSSCRRGTDHLGIISFMALPYGPPLACKWILFESCTTMHSVKPIHFFLLYLSNKEKEGKCNGLHKSSFNIALLRNYETEISRRNSNDYYL